MIISEQERTYLTDNLWECISHEHLEECPMVEAKRQHKHKHEISSRRRCIKNKKRVISRPRPDKYSRKQESKYPKKSMPGSNRGTMFILAIFTAGVAGFMLAMLFAFFLFAGLVTI